MTEQKQTKNAVVQTLDRVPEKLKRILVVVTIVYFAGFLWTYTHGIVERLFIPFQWKYFFEQREMAAVLGGRWFFYGSTVSGLFINLLVMLGLIAGGFYAYGFIQQKKQ